MFCQKCGKEIEEGSIYCPSCGEKVAQDEVTSIGNTVKKSKYFPMIIGVGVLVIAELISIPVIIANRSKANSLAVTTVVSADDRSQNNYVDDFEVNDVDQNVEDDEPEEEIAKEQKNDNSEKKTPKKKHRYELLHGTPTMTWTEASFEAAANSNDTELAYLVTIESEEEWNDVMEQTCLMDYVDSITRVWVGAYRDDEDNYIWLDEKLLPDGNKHWWHNEWTNDKGKEISVHEPSRDTQDDIDNGVKNNCVCIRYGEHTTNYQWVYDDVPNDIYSADNSVENHIGYIVEYEEK